METYVDENGDLQPIHPFKDDDERLEFLLTAVRRDAALEADRRAASQSSQPPMPDVARRIWETKPFIFREK